jgi:hypothetical protein
MKLHQEKAIPPPFLWDNQANHLVFFVQVSADITT